MTDGRDWARAAKWLLFLGPFFFLSYGAATWITAQRAAVGSVVYGWEARIPFIPWTIVPYWSIDVLYGISLFVCANARELDMHARRLLTAQIVAVTCFILMPLQFTFIRPESDGIAGFLFDSLAKFDKPFNQAPSLHIALLVILWDRYAAHLHGVPRWLMHGWFALIGISVLTTWQHHFLDLPTGALLGFFCLWLWPEDAPGPLASVAWTTDAKRRRLAGYYAGGALLFTVASLPGGAALWCLWPAVALLLVAANYALIGAEGFQKAGDGRLSPAVWWLLAPYRLAAWANSRIWTRHDPPHVAIARGVMIGRLPLRAPGTAVIDLCAELPGPGGVAIPMLDLATPPPDRLRQAAEAIEATRAAGPVLVCCALGYGRSAAAIATWLLMSGEATTARDAIARIRSVRPRVAVNDSAHAAIDAAGRLGP